MAREHHTEGRIKPTDTLNPHNIPIVRIKGFTDNYSIESDQELLRKRLQKHKLWGTNLGYRALNPTDISTTLERGTDIKGDYLGLCIVHPGMRKGEKPSISDGAFTLLERMQEYRGEAPQAAFIIYDLDQMKYINEPKYKFTDPLNKAGAIVAVVIIEDFGLE